MRVPARPDYARIVRVGAAAIGLRQGMSFAEIDDLRLAIDEAMIVLLHGTGSDANGDMTVTYRIDGARFELEAVYAPAVVTGDAIGRFDEIAAGLVDDYVIDASAGSLRLVKTAAGDG